jgi:VCBS repeat-containing protein
VNGSTYQQRMATLNVSLSGVWVYHFTQVQVQHLTQEIAGESQQQASAALEKVDGVAQVSIHIQRLDFKDLLPTNPQRITVQFFYIVS